MAVSARWERAEHKRFLTVNAPLFVEWRGERLRAESWSLGGLVIASAVSAAPEPGTTERLRLALPFQGFEMSFEVNAKVFSSDPRTGGFEVEFANLGSRERDLMCHFLDDLVRGRMSEVEGTIKRIDVPVEPLALEPESPLPQQSAAPVRRANAGLMTALYSLAGMIVFGYLGLLVHGHFFRFESENAALTIPTETVLSLGEGHVQWSSLQLGDAVKAGDIIMSIYDNQLERDIELNTIAVREKETRLTMLQQRTGDDPQRLSNIATSRTNNIARMRLQIDSLVARMQAVEQEMKRLAAAPRINQNALRLEEAKKRILAYQKAIEAKQLELKARLEKDVNVAAVRPTQSLAQAELVRDLSPAELQAAHAENDLEFAQQRLQALIGHRDRLAVRAPFDGVITAMPRVDKASVRKGDPVATVEKRVAPAVTAYLAPADALRIAVGDHTRVYVPSAGSFLEGTIRAIDKMSGALEKRTGTHTVSSPSAAWTKVLVQLTPAAALDDRQRYQAGLPVVVQFERRWVSTAVAANVPERPSQLPELRTWLDRFITRAQARQP